MLGRGPVRDISPFLPAGHSSEIKTATAAGTFVSPLDPWPRCAGWQQPVPRRHGLQDPPETPVLSRVGVSGAHATAADVRQGSRLAGTASAPEGAPDAGCANPDLAGSVRRVGGMLVVGDHEGDRIDDKIIPPEALGVLRGAVVLAVVLCLLVPLALLVVWPALSLEQISGVAGAPRRRLVGRPVDAGCRVRLGVSAGRHRPRESVCAAPGAGGVRLLQSGPGGDVAPLVVGTGPFRHHDHGDPRGRNSRRRPPGCAHVARCLVACILNGMMAGFLGLATTPAGALFKGRVLYVGAGAGAVLGLSAVGRGAVPGAPAAKRATGRSRPGRGPIGWWP
jgi:hypothetical protein